MNAIRPLGLLLVVSVIVCTGCEPPRRPIGNASDLGSSDDTSDPTVGDGATDPLDELKRNQEEWARELIERQPKARSLENVRKSDALAALWKMGPKAEEAILTLTEALDDWQPEVRGFAARALGQMGAEAKGAVPALAEVLRDQATYVVPTGFKTVETPFGEMRAMGQETVYVSANAAEALRRIGPAAKKAVPALTKLLSNAQPSVRGHAARALGRMETDAALAIPALASLLHDGAEYHPETEHGGYDRTGWSVHQIMTGFDSETVRVCDSATEALVQIGPEITIPTLTDLLQDKDHQVRIAAVWALGKMGADAKDAIPDLKSLLEDENEQVRQAAAEALKAIDPREE